MKNLSRILILTTTIFGMTSCNFKKSERSHNEDAKDTKLTIENTPDAAKDIQSQERKEDLTVLSNNVSQAKTAGELASLLKSLEAKAINPETMMNVRDNKSNDVRNTLSVYNAAIIKLSEVAPNSPELLASFDKYEKMTLAGCNSELRNCLNFSFLKTDPNSANVIQLIVSQLDKKMDAECKADCSENLKKYYNLLAFSFDLSNGIRSTEREFLYIKRAQEYGALFQKENPTNKDFFKKHGTIFENIVSQYKANGEDKRFAEFVKAFKPWNYSRLNANPFPFGMQQMFAFAAKNYLYTTDKKDLSPELRDSIEQSQKEGDKVGPSFKMVVNKLKTDPRSAGIFKGLNFDITITDNANFYNEYFFMVDRLYRGHIGIDEAASFWEGSKQDGKALLDVVNFYTKVEFLRRIFNTNEYMADTFTKPDMANDTLFKQVVMQSEPLTKQWNMMFSNMENISIFVSQQLRNTTANSNDFKEVQLMIDTVKRNATFLSTYPNMLLLSYVMIDANASLKFNTWWGAELSIDPATIMGLLLDGAFPRPWFVFGGGTTTLDRTEMIFAYHYMLNTGVFETMANLKDSKFARTIDRVSFFKKAIKKTLQDDIDHLKDATQKMRDATSSDSNYATMLNVCDNEAKNKKDYEVAMKLTELQYYSVFGNENRGLLSSIHKLYSGAGPMSAFNDIRASLEPRLTQVKAMMDVLNYNLETTGKTPADIAQLKKDLQQEMDNIDNAKKTFLKTMVAQHKLVTNCLNNLTKIERDRQSKLFIAEMQHLEKVYNKLTYLHDYKGKDKAAEIAKAAAELGLTSDENISQDSYVYTQYGLFNRLARESQNMKPAIKFETPDKYTIDSLQTVIQKINFINSVTHDVVDKKDFISSGMTLLNAQGSTTLLWLQESASIDGWQTKIATMVSLYKMGFDSDLQNDPNSSIQAVDIIKEVIDMTAFVNITDEEKIWLNKMNRRERISRDKLRGFLFENSESDFKGILDNFYANATDIRGTLNQATDFYISSKNIGRFLFPVPATVQSSITDRYKKTIQRGEALINDFEAAITKVQESFDSKAFQITYRLEDQGDFTYSTDMVDGGESVLLDIRKKNEIKSLLKEFHLKRTCSFYKSTEATCN